MTRRLALTAFLILFGGAMVVVGWTMRRDSNRGRDWPTANATIVEKHVEKTGKNTLWYPVVKYRYDVAGKSYTNDRVYAVGRIDDREPTVKSLVDGLHDPLPIHYDPDAPADSYIFATPGWIHWIALGVGGLLVLVGIARLASKGVAKA